MTEQTDEEYREAQVKEYHERAVKCVEQILHAVDEDEVVVRDTIANLMHWCDAKNLDFDNELRIARDNYYAEKEGIL